MEATRQHATSILALLHAHAYLLNHLNDFFVCRCWRDVPPEWQPFLLSLSKSGLAALPSMTRPVPGAPASLVDFVALAASLALPRTPSQEEATRLCWAVVSARTVSLSVTAPSSCGENPYPSNTSPRGMAPTSPPNAPGLDARPPALALLQRRQPRPRRRSCGRAWTRRRRTRSHAWPRASPRARAPPAASESSTWGAVRATSTAC